MIFLLEFPVFWLLFYPNIGGVIGNGLVYVAGCLMVERNRDYFKRIFKKNNGYGRKWLPVAVLLSGLEGWGFYRSWLPSTQLKTVASMVHLPVETFLLLTTVALTIASIPGIYVFLRLCTANRSQNDVEMKDKGTLSSVLQKKEVLLCLIISVAAALQMGLRPFTSVNPEIDSSVFLYIGKMMHQGYVPYKDLFDHKGPVLFLVQYLGMFLSSDRFLGLGVWLIEVVNMFLFVLFILKITKLLTNSTLVQYVSTWIIPVFCGQLVYRGGNYTEEYALPWITIALYILLKFFLTESYRNWDIIVLGISFSLVFFLRANMIAVWITFIPVVIFMLIYRNQWVNLCKCISLFLTGFCCVALPILVYCLYTNSLTDMISCYFVFNFAYTDTENTLGNQLMTMVFLAHAVRIAVPAMIVEFAYYRKNKVYVLNCIYYAISLVLSAMSGREYLHYGMILLPASIVFVVYLVRMLEQVFTAARAGSTGIKIRIPLITKQVAFAALVSVVFTALTVPFSLSFDRTSEAIPQYILANTQPEEDVLTMGNSCYEYLVTNRETKNKFFYQNAVILGRQELMDEFMSELEVHPSSTIIFPGSIDRVEKDNSGYGAVYQYLETECTKGTYTREEYEDFFVYRVN